MYDLLEAYLVPSMDDFADHVYNFDSVVQLNYWRLTMLNRIKKSIAFELDIELTDDSDISDYSSEDESEYESDEDDSEYTEAEDDDGYGEDIVSDNDEISVTSK